MKHARIFQKIERINRESKFDCRFSVGGDAMNEKLSFQEIEAEILRKLQAHAQFLKNCWRKKVVDAVYHARSEIDELEVSFLNSLVFILCFLFLFYSRFFHT